MPTRPPSRCGDPGCRAFATNRGRCDDHQPIAWAGRDDKAARYGLSSGQWRALKARVTRRDNACCYACGADPADTGDEDDPFVLDHKVPISEGGSPRDLDNLGLLCPPCDTVKSADEARRGNERRRQRRRQAAGL